MRRFAALVPAGREVLDVASGSGRHARLFAERGHPVLAVDRDVAALAEAAGIAGVQTVRRDLEDGSSFPPPGRRFAAVVVANYLHRPLLAPLVAAVDDGGVLIYETFAKGNGRFGRPRSHAFLLEPGELLDAVRGELQLVAYEQRILSAPRPAAVQRICACRPSTLVSC